MDFRRVRNPTICNRVVNSGGCEVNVKRILLLAVVVSVLIATAAASFAQPEHHCKKCGRPITGSCFETNGEYYHEECFTCDHCGKPIKGEYVTQGDKNFHTDCFEREVARKCALCGRAIQGKYLIDFWGNSYHLEHRKDASACEYCGRFISAITTRGGVRYSDGRTICNICRESAVTSKEEAERIMTEVAGRLERLGMAVSPDIVDLHLIGLAEMKEKSGKGSSRLTGFTDFTETRKLFGVSKARKIDVYILYGMPRIDVVGTVAHELAHVWQFLAGRFKNDRALSEGSCNFASYLVLQHYPCGQTDYVLANIKDDKDKIYGEGFRRVKRFADDNGIRAWLELLREKDKFPRGY